MKLYIRRKTTTFNSIEIFAVATEDGKMRHRRGEVPAQTGG